MDTQDIDRLLADQRRYFLSGATLPVEFRVRMLRKLRDAVRKYESEIGAALTADLTGFIASAFAVRLLFGG